MAGGRGRDIGVNKRKSRRINHQDQEGYRNHVTKQLLTSATTAAYSFLLENDLLLLPSQFISLEYLLSSISLSSFFPLHFSSSTLTPWFHRFISSTDVGIDPQWTHCFRMSRSTFSILLSLLSPSLVFSLPSVRPDSALASALFRLAHGASYKSLARRFGFDSSSDACRVFYTVCKLVNENLGHLFELRSDIERTVVRFGLISLPNCCGVLGFGRFAIDGELLGSDGALLVQALVDSEGRFLDVSAGWPNTIKPDSILHQTKLFADIEESSELLNGPAHKLCDAKLVPRYILGNTCLPLLPWLLTPYVESNEEDDSLGLGQREFNAAHSRAMSLVGNAFGRVRALWKLIDKRWKEESIESFPFVIVTACLLHNFLINSSEPLPDDNWEVENFPDFEGEADETGWKIRDALADHLTSMSLRR